jgi:hypothetical protein
VPPRPPTLPIGVEARQPRPGPVSYARWLLFLQASIWGLLCVGAIVNSAHPKPWFDPAFTTSAAIICGLLAAAETWLGLSMPRGSDKMRHAVIALESFMACLGAVLTLFFAIPQGGFIPAVACLSGGGMSLVAAIGLIRPPARQHFTRDGNEGAHPHAGSRGDDHGSTSFWRLTQLVQAARATALACSLRARWGLG